MVFGMEVGQAHDQETSHLHEACKSEGQLLFHWREQDQKEGAKASAEERSHADDSAPNDPV